MADILQKHYDDYWWPTYCWIEESNRILGYVVIPEKQAKKENRLEFEGVEQGRFEKLKVENAYRIIPRVGLFVKPMFLQTNNLIYYRYLDRVCGKSMIQ
jgi:hypothetical protein